MAVAALALLQISRPAVADPPIWANAKVVKAVHTDCGSLHYLVLKGNAVNVSAPPDSPGCKSSHKTYRQVNVSKAFLRPQSKGLISESNVDAGTILCSNGDALVNLGSARDLERAIRQSPAPGGCTYTLRKYQYVSSIGNIPFTNVANGGTMSVAESLAIHAKERDRAIAECNASAACRAEVRRISAINAYYECLKPTQVTHICTRPR